MLSRFISPALPPAFKAALGQHAELQLSFCTEIGNKMLAASQQMMQLNLQLMHAVIAQMDSANHQLMQAQNPAEFASAMVNQVHPIVEHWRSYQQCLPNVLASTQVELTKAAESHVPQVTRSAVAIADELTRVAAEETEKISANQRALLEKISINSDETADTSRPGRSIH
jgi:phasin family protein